MSKKIKISVVLSVLAASMFTSCYKDVTVPVVPVVTRDVSFSADVLPIFTSNCAGCHNTGGQAPDLSASNAYASVTGSDYIDLSAPASSEIYERMSSSSQPMPPTGANVGNAAIVLAWIKQGAKNN